VATNAKKDALVQAKAGKDVKKFGEAGRRNWPGMYGPKKPHTRTAIEEIGAAFFSLIT
jgi:hypothetical protein